MKEWDDKREERRVGDRYLDEEGGGNWGKDQGQGRAEKVKEVERGQGRHRRGTGTGINRRHYLLNALGIR